MLLELGFVLTVGVLHVGGVLTGRFSSGWQYVSIVLPAVTLAYCAVMTPAIYHLTYVLPHRFGLDNRSRLVGLAESIESLLVKAIVGLGWSLGTEKFKKSNFHDIADDDLNKHKVQAIIELASLAHLHNLRVYVTEMADESSEFFVGCFTSGRKKVMVISDTMVDALSQGELAVVAAHELAHLKRGHCGSAIFGVTIRLGMCVGLAYLFFPLLVTDHNDWRQLAGAWPVLLMAIWLGEFALLPARMASSRRQERRANHDALKMTNDPAAFISAMIKLADNNLISGRPTLLEKALFQTHPTLDEVIHQARRFAAAHDIELESQPPPAVSS